MENITSFKLRGFFPNYNYYKFLIDNRGSFPVHKIGEGYRKPIVEYFSGSKKSNELEIDFEDAIFLLNHSKRLCNKHIEDLIKAKNKDQRIIKQLQFKKTEFYRKKLKTYESIQFTENEYVIPACSTNKYDIGHISH